MPIAKDDRLRTFYKRLALALPDPHDRAAFERQVSSARIITVDNEHDRFELREPMDPLDADETTVDAVYSDGDGNEVNVIVHFVDKTISWAERYRNLGGQIELWPPPSEVPLRLARGGPP